MIPRIRRREYAVAYTYILPFLLLFALFGAFPIIHSLILSFSRQSSFGTTHFVGLRNYLRLFQDELFLKALFNTVWIWVFSHIIVLPGAFLLAFVLNQFIGRGREFFRTLFFTPMVTSSVAISLVFLTIFGRHHGLINQLLAAAGLEAVDWFGGDGRYIKPMIVTIFSWKWIGYNMVLYSAGMLGIDNTYYECARVEGASVWKMMMRITIPLMKPVILFTLVMSFIGGLQIFDEPYILLARGGSEMGGGTNYAGLVIARYLYYHAFNRWNFGYSSAMAYILVAIIISLSSLSNRLFRRND